MLRQDPRDYQILFLSLFLVLGIGTRDWTLRFDLMLVVMLTCLLTQWVAVSLFPNPIANILNLLHKKPDFLNELDQERHGEGETRRHGEEPVSLERSEWLQASELNATEKENYSLLESPDFRHRVSPSPHIPTSPRPLQTEVNPKSVGSWLVGSSQVASLKSATITGLSLSLLLRADHYSTMVLAGCLAILSKFLFQVKGKHFFNPANFGIIAALMLTHDAWVSPGQWGDEGWYALLFAGTGGIVLKRVGRWDTTAAFLGLYTLLEIIRNVWLGWTWDVCFHRLMSGSLLLFALFMITDPRSIPNARIGRLLWAGCIASLAFILRNQFFVSTAIFWALFALSPVSVLLDWVWSAPRFSWLDVVGAKSTQISASPQINWINPPVQESQVRDEEQLTTNNQVVS